MIKTITKRVLSYNPVYQFSIRRAIFDNIYSHDTSSQTFKITQSPIQSVPHGVQINEQVAKEASFTTSKLSNGITIVTEATTLPSTVKLAIFLDIGTRDQTTQSSGSLLSIKNTLFKTVLNTNQTINYGIHQMSGGKFQMNYDREATYWTASCLAQDTIDVFSVLTDCALQPRSVVAANVAIHKNQYSHKLDAFLGGNQLFNDTIHQVAYGGHHGLGLPLKGLKKNVPYLNSRILQQFQLDNVAPERIVIAGGGIDNHQQFVDLAYEKLSNFSLASKQRTRTPAVYQGGEVRNLTESNTAHVALVFDTAKRNDTAYYIAHQILGLNRRTGRIHRNILQKHSFVENAEPFIAAFTDSGLFGISLSGSAAHINDIVNAGINELRQLQNVTAEQFATAKALLRLSIFSKYQCRSSRLEYAAKNQYYFGTHTKDYAKDIDSLTIGQFQQYIQSALRSRLTLVAHGGEVNNLASYDKISNLLN